MRFIGLVPDHAVSVLRALAGGQLEADAVTEFAQLWLAAGQTEPALAMRAFERQHEGEALPAEHLIKGAAAVFTAGLFEMSVDLAGQGFVDHRELRNHSAEAAFVQGQRLEFGASLVEGDLGLFAFTAFFQRLGKQV